MAGISTKTSIRSFIIPYFIQTDPKGLVYAVCDRMGSWLSDSGKPGYLSQPLSVIFNQLSHSKLPFISHIEENGLPDSFELEVNVSLNNIAPL
jgi:hypothetical protein